MKINIVYFIPYLTSGHCTLAFSGAELPLSDSSLTRLKSATYASIPSKPVNGLATPPAFPTDNVSPPLERDTIVQQFVEIGQKCGHHVPRMKTSRLRVSSPKRDMLIGAKRVTLAASKISMLSTSTQLSARMSDEDEISSVQVDDEIDDKMDLAGFGGYLAPYALALIASIGVTVAFFKFVLLDY
jgi:hypothetical protein